MNKTTATEINKKFVNLPEDLQRYIFEFKQPNIYIEDIDKELSGQCQKFDYWRKIYGVRFKEYTNDKFINPNFDYSNWENYLDEANELTQKYEPFKNLRKYLLNNGDDYEQRIFSFLKVGDIFFSENNLYKIVKKTESLTHYKTIIPVYVKFLPYWNNFFDIQNYRLDDKIYKKKEIKKGVIKIIKSGLY